MSVYLLCQYDGMQKTTKVYICGKIHRCTFALSDSLTYSILTYGTLLQLTKQMSLSFAFV